MTAARLLAAAATLGGVGAVAARVMKKAQVRHVEKKANAKPGGPVRLDKSQ